MSHTVFVKFKNGKTEDQKTYKGLLSAVKAVWYETRLNLWGMSQTTLLEKIEQMMYNEPSEFVAFTKNDRTGKVLY